MADALVTPTEVAALAAQPAAWRVVVVTSVAAVAAQAAVTVHTDAPIDEVVATMEKHQIRRVPVVDEQDCCVGIISQADVAWKRPEREVAELVREVSRDTGRDSR